MFPFDPQRTARVGDDTTRSVEDTLLIRRCADCDKLFGPLTDECSSCSSGDLEWVCSSGAGSIVSWRTVDRTGTHGALTPLTIAIVALDEGPWVYTTIEGEIRSAASRPVRVQFQPRPQLDRFPVFRVSTHPGYSGCRQASRSPGCD